MTVTRCGGVSLRAASLFLQLTEPPLAQHLTFNPQFPRFYITDEAENGDDDGGWFDYVDGGGEDDDACLL